MEFDPLLIGFEESGTPWWYKRGDFWLCSYRNAVSDEVTWELSWGTNRLLEFPYETTMSAFFERFINSYPPMYGEDHDTLIAHVKTCYRIFKVDQLCTQK